MANMRYCRFRNTEQDVRECIEALEEGDTISEDEAVAAMNMFVRVLDFCKSEGIIPHWDGMRLEDMLNDHKEED